MSDKIVVGWREFCALPTLNIPIIKAKIDTGAKTSCLHTAEVSPFENHGQKYVKFLIHPLQEDTSVAIDCTAPIVEQRNVRNSGGEQELRYVIQSDVEINGFAKSIELTLTNREDMKFRMLLGREALNQFAVVDPSESFLLGQYQPEELLQLYQNKD